MSDKKKEQLDSYVDEAVKNIREDRAIASKLLVDLVQTIGNQSDHQSSGLVAAKYIETLQRSNEQLTKLITALGKKVDSTAKISEEEIYSMIQGDKEDAR